MKRRTTARELTLPEHLALMAGFDDEHGAPFASWDDARAAWAEHRAGLMARCRPNERPEAWWAFEGPPGLGADDPAEPIAPDRWLGAPESRPLAELPKPSAAVLLARRERWAREARLDHRRRKYLAAHSSDAGADVRSRSLSSGGSATRRRRRLIPTPPRKETIQ